MNNGQNFESIVRTSSLSIGGDFVLIVKADGLREKSDLFTVLIQSPQRELLFRRDGRNLDEIHKELERTYSKKSDQEEARPSGMDAKNFDTLIESICSSEIIIFEVIRTNNDTTFKATLSNAGDESPFFIEASRDLQLLMRDASLAHIRKFQKC